MTPEQRERLSERGIDPLPAPKERAAKARSGAVGHSIRCGIGHQVR
ncbi:hypothetical protein [Streptomyces sp. NBC_01538]